MKKVIAVIVLLVVAGSTAIGLRVWWINTRVLPVVETESAVQMIAYQVSELFAENPAATQAEIDDVIEFLSNGVINLKVDSNGRTVDPFGTAFRVEYDPPITRVTSAGRDRQFGTEDDIKYEHR